jgi:hypothetical protein
MAYVLLWIESLAVSLLWVAALLACIVRLRHRRLRVFLLVLVVLLPLAGYVGLTGLAGLLKYCGLLGTRFYQILGLTVCFVIGSSWVLHRGLHRGSEEPRRPVAVSWPRRKLAIALGVAIALHLTTFWNLDLAARQWLAVHRAEAGTLALSVAPPRVPDRENAALAYQQAFEAMGPLESWNETWDEKWNQWAGGEASFDPKEPRLREFLEQQASVLALLRRAAEKPGCYFDRDYGGPEPRGSVPELHHLLMAARLLALNARCTAADGHLGAALKDVQVSFSMAEHVSSEPILVSLLLSITIERTAADSLEAVLASGQPSAEELAALDVDLGVSYARCLGRTLRTEEAFLLSEFSQMRVGWVSVFDPGRSSGTRGAASFLYRLSYGLFMPSREVASLRRRLDEMRRLAIQPYYQAKKDWKRFDEELESSSGRHAGHDVMSMFSGFVEPVVASDARHRVVLVALAMCRYRAAHNRFPDKLEELTPEFLAAVPRDPFDGKPIRLRQTDGSLVVYSIGPDMTDNGGTPLDSTTKTGDVTFTLVESGEWRVESLEFGSIHSPLSTNAAGVRSRSSACRNPARSRPAWW